MGERTAVITGCLQGIGKEALRVFAENDYNVYACAYQNNQEFEDYCQLLRSKHSVDITPIYFDMSDNDAIKAAVKEIQKEKKEIHALINIAGINRDAYFSMVSMTDMMETFQVNFFSQIVFSQYISKMMIRNKTKGSIVFTSSTAALDGIVGQTSYASSKAALIGAMRCMAIELGNSGIRVNAVAPGVIKSPMTDKLSEDIIEDRKEKINLHRLGDTTDVANLYLFLASELSSHITGQVIRIDGGTR